MRGLWESAGAGYGIPWQVLAAINKIESNFGRNMGPSSAGAVGWMQFMPETWLRWGMDGDGDRIADPWNPHDAIYAAARYLAAAGGRTDLQRGIFAYNHAQWYVDDVLELAKVFGQGSGAATFTLDRMQVDLQAAQQAVAEASQALQHAKAEARRLAGVEKRFLARADAQKLLSDRLALEHRAGLAAEDLGVAAEQVAGLREELESAQAQLEQARSRSLAASFAPAAGTLLAAPAYSGDYVFPVGGGPSVVSVASEHHDYPAADIAAPTGAPLYALSNGVVERAWHVEEGRCGIGFTIRTADGLSWTYCHLSYLEASVQTGAALSVGQPVGLVGSTGSSTGPHLHLQLQPATAYPQQLGWFQSFAGVAFRWQGNPALPAPPAPHGDVFTPVPHAEGGVVLFTR
jgi:murein DD-endopeptidase MepM/ murein hydrolase activator NlpD